MEEEYFVGVDVGTGSVRAALVTKNGTVKSVSTKPTETWTPQPGYYEQSSNDIWAACCAAVKDVTEQVDQSSVKGIGFDATCSLVAVDQEGNPLTISPTGNNEQNVILWLDHRALEEANFINSLEHSVLRYVGGKISLEMETPKLLWLKKNMEEECWSKAGYFFDLPDFLTWRATGSHCRSLCSLVCKWTYMADSKGNCGWNRDYFDKIGLGDLSTNNWEKIGSKVCEPGQPCGEGLSTKAAEEMGLLPGIAVSTSIIDAHAGGLGMIGCQAEGVPSEFRCRLGLVCGTSTCHMAVSDLPLFVNGVWGPYYSAMVPGMWLNEGGQSATGKLIDHIIETHPATASIRKQLKDGEHIQEYLSKVLEKMATKEELPDIGMLTRDLHVLPDFHGNRSPLADPTLRGMISGLDLSDDEENLALLYLATVQALAYGTRYIVKTMRGFGHSSINTILVCGGLARNPLFVQMQADALQMPVLCPEEQESMMVGAAILAACAAGAFPDVRTAAMSMGGKGRAVHPNKEMFKYHDKKFAVFLKMVDHQQEYNAIMCDKPGVEKLTCSCTTKPCICCDNY